MNERPARPPASRGRGGTPRWVIISAIAVAILAVAVAVVMLAGGGQHGPGRHMPNGNNTDSSHVPPPGGHRPGNGASLTPAASLAPPTSVPTTPADHAPQPGAHG
ncbi:hypothetical protein [Nocardia asiatica]